MYNGLLLTYITVPISHFIQLLKLVCSVCPLAHEQMVHGNFEKSGQHKHYVFAFCSSFAGLLFLHNVQFFIITTSVIISKNVVPSDFGNLYKCNEDVCRSQLCYCPMSHACLFQQQIHWTNHLQPVHLV